MQEKLRKLQGDLKELQRQKTVLQTQEEQYQKQLDDLIIEMEELGVTPETIEGEIQKLQETIEHDLTFCEQEVRKIKNALGGV